MSNPLKARCSRHCSPSCKIVSARLRSGEALDAEVLAMAVENPPARDRRTLIPLLMERASPYKPGSGDFRWDLFHARSPTRRQRILEQVSLNCSRSTAQQACDPPDCEHLRKHIRDNAETMSAP